MNGAFSFDPAFFSVSYQKPRGSKVSRQPRPQRANGGASFAPGPGERTLPSPTRTRGTPGERRGGRLSAGQCPDPLAAAGSGDEFGKHKLDFPNSADFQKASGNHGSALPTRQTVKKLGRAREGRSPFELSIVPSGVYGGHGAIFAPENPIFQRKNRFLAVSAPEKSLIFSGDW